MTQQKWQVFLFLSSKNITKFLAILIVQKIGRMDCELNVDTSYSCIVVIKVRECMMNTKNHTFWGAWVVQSVGHTILIVILAL